MGTKTISFRIPDDLAIELDSLVKQNGFSKTSYLVKAMRSQLTTSGSEIGMEQLKNRVSEIERKVEILCHELEELKGFCK